MTIPTMNRVFGQDIAELASEKYLLQIDDQTFQIFYGFKGSLEVEIEAKEIENPKVTSMNINPERRSLEINFEKSAYEGPLWVGLPNELITAEGGKFKVLINDKEKIYELTYYTDKIAAGFILPSKSSHVEIIGIRVIPEFSATSLFWGSPCLQYFILLEKILR